MSFKGIIGLFTFVILLSSIQLALFLQPQSIQPLTLSQSEMQQDLLQLLDEIEQHSAFYSLNPEPIKAQIKQEITRLKSRYSLGVSNLNLAPEITKVLALLADPGASITSLSPNKHLLPLKLRPMGEKWLALDNQDTPLHSEYPFITHIDGLPMSVWVEQSKKYQPQSNASHSALVKWLHQLDLLRQDIGLEIKPEVRLTLSNSQAQSQHLTLATTKEMQDSSTPLPKLINIPNNTKVLTLTRLNKFETEPSLRTELKQAAQEPLLILDMRQAKGYSDTFLKIIIQHQINISSQEQLLGFSHYRISPKFRNDFLYPINFHPLNSFNSDIQRSLDAVSQRIFVPNPKSFSPWFARTIANIKASEISNAENKPLTKYLALIIGPQCRQDCAWLAQLASHWPNTLLIGEPTSGDIARKYSFKLTNSQLKVTLSSSLTYNANGKRISGVSLVPDIQISLEQEIAWPGLLALLKITSETIETASEQASTKL